MKIIARLAIALACLCAFAAPGASQDLLTQAKGLYDSASYNEALSALSEIGSVGDVTEVEKYRALCLLALDRPKDAEQSLEHLAMARPLFTLDGSDSSPKLVALFENVRKRTLPEAAKQTYERARASYEKGDFAEAARQFRDVMAMADAAPAGSAALMGDLKMLATGFVKLADAALLPTPEPRTPAPVPPAAASPLVPAVTRPAISAERIYNASDTRVKAPIATSRQIPTWERPAALNFATLQGLLEIIVGEDGSVVGETMLKVINPAYDRRLMQAAGTWRFQPATLDDRPVKYRMTLSIVVPRR
jgi:tetratricopeptide (TPR) repeat protein